MKITVNGQEYDSWDEVPAEYRSLMQGALPDADGDGVPDLLAGTLPTDSTTVHTSMAVRVGDKTYNSIDEAPEAIVETLRAAGLLKGPVPSGTTVPVPGGVAIVHGDPAPPSGPQAAPPLTAGQVMLNGVAVDPTAAAKRKHWWSRG